MKQKTNNLIITLPFVFTIFAIGIINEIKLPNTTSFIENRSLEQKPKFDKNNIKEYTIAYEKFYSDQFIGRETLIKIYNQVQQNLNKSIIQNVYIEDDWLLGKMDFFNNSYLDNKVNTVVELQTEGKKITYFSVPHKGSSLSHLYPKYDTSVADHLENKKYFISELNNKGIDAYMLDDFLKSKYTESELESFYYKTDHHWNALGAYEVTKEILNRLNIDFDDNLYTVIRNTDKEFLGSYNRKLGSLFSKDEELTFIKPTNVENIKMFTYKTNSIIEVNPNDYICRLRDNDEISYGGYYQGDLAYLKVTNEDSITDRKILIVRDSYQAPTTLIFSSVFREVEIIDDRYLSTINKTLDQLIKESNATDVIFFKYL